MFRVAFYPGKPGEINWAFVPLCPRLKPFIVSPGGDFYVSYDSDKLRVYRSLYSLLLKITKFFTVEIFPVLS